MIQAQRFHGKVFLKKFESLISAKKDRLSPKVKKVQFFCINNFAQMLILKNNLEASKSVQFHDFPYCI